MEWTGVVGRCLSFASLACRPPPRGANQSVVSSLVSLVRASERLGEGDKEKGVSVTMQTSPVPALTSPCRVSPSRNVMATYPSTSGKKQVLGGVGGHRTSLP